MSNPENTSDPTYTEASYEEKKGYLEGFLKQEIYDFEYAQASPDQEDLDALEQSLREELVQNIDDYATDISEDYARLIIKYIDLMLEAKGV